VKDWKLELTEDPLWGASIFAAWQGDEETALEHATHLLDLARSQGSRRGQAIALQMIANVTSFRGDFDRARGLYEESLVLAREADDEWLITIVLNNLGGAEVEAGNVERGIELFEESLALGEERGDIERRARQLANLGFARLELGDRSAAQALFADALDAAQAIGLPDHYFFILHGLAATSVTDDPARAARLQGVAEAIAEQLGYPVDYEDRTRRQTLDRLRAASAEDDYLEALTRARGMSANDAVAYALEEPQSGGRQHPPNVSRKV
jgi:tetratricopeptide (TPR) repeat protein